MWWTVASYMEISVHVEADDSEVVRAGNVRDDALAAFPLLRHSHPHVPVPQLMSTKPTTNMTYGNMTAGCTETRQSDVCKRLTPSLASAISAPIHPCTGSSSEPTQGRAYSPPGRGGTGPLPCARNPGKEIKKDHFIRCFYLRFRNIIIQMLQSIIGFISEFVRTLWG